MGYTHLISWSEYEHFLKFYVQKSFRTTADAVQIHVEVLRARGVSNLTVTEI